jgi:hypothetical protein
MMFLVRNTVLILCFVNILVTERTSVPEYVNIAHFLFFVVLVHHFLPFRVFFIFYLRIHLPSAFG